MSVQTRDPQTGRFASTPRKPEPPTARQIAEFLAEIAEMRGMTEFAQQTRTLVASPSFSHWFGA